MVKLFGCLLALLFLSFPTYAAPVFCNTLTTLQDYLDQSPSGGCSVQDKLFTGFTYAGGGGVTADQVIVSVVFSVLPDQDIHGFTFSPTAGVWTSGFALGYTITIDPPTAGTSITSSKLQGNFGNAQNPAFAHSTKSNGLTLDIAFGSEFDIAVFAGVQSLTSLTDVTIPTLGFLISLEETYVQTKGTAPEPGTLALFGLGIAAGFAASRRRKR